MSRPLHPLALLLAAGLGAASASAQGLPLPFQSDAYQRHYGDMGIQGLVQADGRSYVQTRQGGLFPLSRLPKASVMDAAHLQKRDAFFAELPLFGTPPASVSLDAYQTPIRNQEKRDTCTVFATLAGVEAAYKRKYKLNLDLSEQYGWHLFKSSRFSQDQLNKGFRYENDCSYWGNAWIRDLFDVAKAYPLPVEDGQAHADPKALISYLPLRYGTGPIPLGNGTTYRFKYEMDKILKDNGAAGSMKWGDSPGTNLVTQAQVDAFEYAPSYMPWQGAVKAQYGITDYVWLGGANEVTNDMIEQALAAGTEVAVTPDLFWKSVIREGVEVMDWDADLKRDVDAGKKPFPGTHAMLVVGYDHAKQIFFLKNSWGGTSYVRVTYDFMVKSIPEAVVVKDVRSPAAGPHMGSRWVGRWNMDHDGWKGQLIVRRLPDASNAAVRLGSYVDGNGNSHDVNGWLTDGGQGLVFFMAGGNNVTNAGDQTGQRFEVHTYGWEPNYAAGTTTWNGAAYGAFLSRDPIPGQYHAGFDRSLWVGNWGMDHDGWHGTLAIGRVYDKTVLRGTWITYTFFDATYTASDGTAYPFTGTVDRARPWQAYGVIPFPGNPQPFYLNFHTWESNVFSGTTRWNNTPYGVHGIRK